MIARRATLLMLPFGAAVGALFAFTLRNHEFWRDEVQAALIGRLVPLGGFVHAMRLEGSPPLLHLFLKVASALLPAPTALALAGALGYAVLLFGTFDLLRVLSGRPWASAVATLVLAGTNTFVYELGVIVRPYGLGLGLCLAGSAQLLRALAERRPRRALAGALLCGLAAISSDHAACLAGAALVSFVLVALARRRDLPSAAATLAALPFFAVTAYLMSPFPERTREASGGYHPTLDQVLLAAGKCIENGGLVGGWWLHPGPEPPPSYPIFPAFAAGMALVLATRLVRCRHRLRAELFLLGLLAASWGTLLYIFTMWYLGGYRHHLFLWIPAVVFVTGWLLDGRWSRGWPRVPLAAAALLLAPWLGYQYYMAWCDLSGDVRGALSQTKRVAPLLPAGAHVLAEHDYSVLGVRFWRDDVTLRSPDGRGREFGWLVVDRAWHERVPLPPLLYDECRRAPDRLFYAGRLFPELTRCAKVVDRAGAQIPTEIFDLYRVDCGCVGQRGR